MLRPRLIACLLVQTGGLVKTRRFTDAKYVGDPINAVRIFNEKEIDELMVLDIDATARSREPDYRLIETLAAECRMPLCYGGGVKTTDQIEKIIGLGVEKVALSSALVERPVLVREASHRVGSQSAVAVLDVKRCRHGDWEVHTHNGTRRTRRHAAEFAAELEERGIGEIVVNSIDRDGEMGGYDLDAVSAVRERVSVPITCLGGAGSMRHVEELITRFGVIGAAAGSLFVFKGPFRAVLISYPDRAARDVLLKRLAPAPEPLPQPWHTLQ